jgi:hypothetical protein
MQVRGPTLFHEFHAYEPHIGLETLWFFKAYGPGGPDPADDPNATKLIGPVSPGECAAVVESIKLVLRNFGLEVGEESGMDD